MDPLLTTANEPMYARESPLLAGLKVVNLIVDAELAALKLWVYSARELGSLVGRSIVHS